MRLLSVAYLVHQSSAARDGYSWDAGRWIPNSNFEMTGNNRNQGGFDSRLMNFENKEGTKSTCFAEHVDIDGNLFKTNVVENQYNISSGRFPEGFF